MDTSRSSGGNVAAEEKPKAPSQSRVRRRNRMITSCLECRRRKLKCDKLHPCTNCSKFSRDCLFLAPALDSVSQQRLNEIKEKMGSLERVLEQDVARKEGKNMARSNQQAQRRTSADLPGGEESTSDDEAAVPEDEKGLEPTPLAVIDASYEDDANDDVLDLGIKVGKMRLTERLGGFFRPALNEELGHTLNDPAADRRTPDEKLSAIPQLPDDTGDFLAPGPSYIAPGSGFIFGDVGNKRSLINFLPAKGAADVLVRNYFQNVHFIARVVHWPSFQLHYDNFWTSVLAGLEPPAWQQSVVLSVLFAAVASMSEEEVTAVFARPKNTVLGNFQTGTEVALSKAQFLRATKLETLQALVIYLIPMCRDQLSRAHSVIVGMAVRLAECMGLHRDPQDVYGLSAVECHVRRIVWFQLCFLDFRTCESQGPRPGIKREDYDTKFPLNIHDADLLRVKPQESKTKWTDMTASRIRFECTEMQRVVWQDRIRIEKKKISLTHVLGKIEGFRKAMEAKYAPVLDLEVPIQKYAHLVMTLMIQRMYVMVLHRYLNNASNRVPERLRQLTVHSGVQSMESAVAIERMPELSQWRWYSGAYQQWHIAFLLLTVIYASPTLREADRIWNIVDFVFEPDLSLSRTQKARAIIAAIRDRTTVYRELRRIRIPVSMKDGLDPQRKQSEDNTKDGNPGDAHSAGHTPETAISSRVNEGASQPSYALDQSWSFDMPATLYVERKYMPGGDSFAYTQLGPPQQSQSQSQPPSQPQQTPPRTDVNQASPGQPTDLHSPSDSGTNESWPPLITPDQVSWHTALSAGTDSSPPAPVAAVKPIPGVPHRPVSGGSSPFGIGSGFPSDQVNIPQLPNANARGDSVMLDIDWAEWDRLFPPESNPADFGMGRRM
ncbi:uncharacterized protein Z518_04016 [Rhinocladiella mackenziei CBS 650.93]|uniref:Zn(2)-C6 fungal-type domain-containing protein n=1 Tax=Rhinocladiella mackenziei CBS 650.93 TaxID=1442369 RepID=A0A0D2FVC2_9EURO|nr:uncharacterized protein Z518_04016 [Rhinocladiella mackenziei CBS 650.93]KIX06042.1 hypothetical protein Z518_04016 [Rhinocladiella mackenziei CBS 650.93]